jgi:hypothetical protein
MVQAPYLCCPVQEAAASKGIVDPAAEHAGACQATHSRSYVDDRPNELMPTARSIALSVRRKAAGRNAWGTSPGLASILAVEHGAN